MKYDCAHCGEENIIARTHIPDDDYEVHTCDYCGGENKITFLVEKVENDREDDRRDEHNEFYNGMKGEV